MRCASAARTPALPRTSAGAGYEEFLEALADPYHSEHDQLKTWIARPFDPTEFDLAEVNRRLTQPEQHSSKTAVVGLLLQSKEAPGWSKATPLRAADGCPHRTGQSRLLGPRFPAPRWPRQQEVEEVEFFERGPPRRRQKASAFYTSIETPAVWGRGGAELHFFHLRPPAFRFHRLRRLRSDQRLGACDAFVDDPWLPPSLARAVSPAVRFRDVQVGNPSQFNGRRSLAKKGHRPPRGAYHSCGARRTAPPLNTGAETMAKTGTESGVYRVTEIIGTSPVSWEDAAKNAVETAAASLRDLRVAEVEKLDVKIEDGKVIAFRTKISLSFKYEE
jgi:flavin-binding protein dodecin